MASRVSADIFQCALWHVDLLPPPPAVVCLDFLLNLADVVTGSLSLFWMMFLSLILILRRLQRSCYFLPTIKSRVKQTGFCRQPNNFFTTFQVWNRTIRICNA